METTKKYTRKELLNKSQLAERGWTESIISKVITVAPIEIRGMYKNSTQKCWPVTYIEELEKSAQFQELKAQAEARRAKGIATAKAKAEKNLAIFNARVDKVEIPRMDPKEIRSTVVEEKCSYFEYRAMMRGENFSFDPDEYTIERWAVNYVRHNLTEYDYILDELAGKVGCGEIYYTVKNRVLDKIAASYPEFAEECDRQKTMAA